jgi:hypothetical protein
MSGLARRLGMSRRTLVDYANKDEFLLTIKEARNRVEEDVESRMNEKHTFTPGLIFNAKNNFDWKDKSEQDITSGGKPIMGGSAYVPSDHSLQEDTETK